MSYRLLLISLAILLLLVSGASAGSKEGGKAGKFSLESTAFKDNASIPKKYTCDGKDINPPLTVRNVPAGAKSLAVVVDDPDAPTGVWVHWVVWNIDPAAGKIAENSVPAGARQGKTDFKKNKYGGPCPPSGSHRYFFKVYALDTALSIPAASTRDELEKAMKGHVLGEARLIGTYRR